MSLERRSTQISTRTPMRFRKARTSRRPRSVALVAAVAALALLAGGCAETDRDLYAAGDSAQTTFRNTLRRLPVWLGGCNAFVQERLIDGHWNDEGGEVVCFWEGFASPVAGGDSRTDSFTARDPGTWRLSYNVGIGCQPDQPLSRSNCRLITRVLSNEFTVAAADDHETFCTETGGEWNIAFCGDLFCGQPNACLALIPGCDCGPDANFVEGVGCVEDPACDGIVGSEQALCEETGGIWDPLSCGHYSCGIAPECEAIIPGCNCGPFAVFEESVGCLAAPCGAP